MFIFLCGFVGTGKGQGLTIVYTNDTTHDIIRNDLEYGVSWERVGVGIGIQAF